MSRFTKTIGYCLLALLFVVGFSHISSAQTVETFPGETPTTPVSPTACTFNSVKIGPLSDAKLPFTLTTTNCTGWMVALSLEEVDSAWNNDMPWLGGINTIPIDPTGTTSVILVPGETKCDNTSSPDCEVLVTLQLTKTTGGVTETSSPWELAAHVKYDCMVQNTCNQNALWSWYTAESIASSCHVLSATFDKYKDTGYVGDSDGNTVYVGSANQIIVDTSHCSGTDIYVSLVEANKTTGGTIDTTDAEPNIENKKINVPASEKVTINVRVGEQRCNATFEIDCVYYIIAGTTPFTDVAALQAPFHFYSLGKPHGRLAFQCDGVCTDLWEYISDNGAADPTNPVAVEDGGVTIDPNSACVDANSGQPIDGCYEVYGGLGDLLKGKLDLVDNKFDVLKQDSFGGLVNAIIAIAIGIGGVLAVGMIMYQGFLYMKTDNVNTKTETRSRILKTTIGFIGLLLIFVFLRTINPDLLNLIPNIDNVTFNTGGDPTSLDATTGSTQISSFKDFALSHGITCSGSGGAGAVAGIANSMKGKITYSMTNRGQTCANDTFCWDCSGFVNAIYSCAGIASPGYTTNSIFAGAEKITSITATTVNGQQMNPGDLIGWTSGSLTEGKPEPYGHVLMYIGGGTVIESTSGNGGKKPGKAIQVKTADAYGVRLKYIKRLSTPTTGTGVMTPGGSVQSPEGE